MLCMDTNPRTKTSQNLLYTAVLVNNFLIHIVNPYSKPHLDLQLKQPLENYVQIKNHFNTLKKIISMIYLTNNQAQTFPNTFSFPQKRFGGFHDYSCSHRFYFLQYFSVRSLCSFHENHVPILETFFYSQSPDLKDRPTPGIGRRYEQAIRHTDRIITHINPFFLKNF